MQSVNRVVSDFVSSPEKGSLFCKSLKHYVPNIELLDNLHYTTFTEEERQKHVARGKEIIDNHVVQPYLNVDDKLFAHIHGDSFANSTLLEGNSMSSTGYHFLSRVKNNPFFNLTKDAIGTFTNFMDYTLATSIILSNKEESDVKQKQINNLATSWSDELSKLAVGKRFLIPGGYTARESGHAMLYEFERKADGNLALHVFNTGNGLNYHQPDGIKGKIKYSPVLTIDNITDDKETLRQFLQTAIECNIPLPYRYASLYDADYIYCKLLPILGGNRVYHTAESNFMTAQHAGICSEKVLHAYLRNILLQQPGGLEQYKQFKKWYKRETLIEYLHDVRSYNRLDHETVQILLLKAFPQFTKGPNKLHDKFSIAPEEDDIALVEYIKEELEKIIRINDTSEPVLTTVMGDFGSVEIATLEPMDNNKDAARPVNQHIRPAVILKSYEDMKSCFDYVEKLYDAVQKDPSQVQNLSEIIDFSNEAIKNFDVSTAYIPSYSRSAAIQKLEKWGDIFSRAQIELKTQLKISVMPETIIHQFKILASIQKLIKETPGNVLGEYRLGQDHFEEALSSPFFLMPSSSLQTEARAVLSHFKSGPELSEKIVDFIADDKKTLKLEYITSDNLLKFYARFVSTSQQSRGYLEEIVRLVSDNGSLGLLPAELYLLKNQHYRCNFLLNAVGSGEISQNIDKFSCTYETTKPEEYDLKLNVVLKDKETPYPEKIKTWPLATSAFSDEYFSSFGDFLSNIMKNRFKREHFVLSKSDMPPLSHNQTMILQKKEEGDHVNYWENEEIKKDFYAIFVNDSQLPLNLLSLFEKYFSKLTEPSFQNLFLVLMFSFGKLQDYLKANPDFSDRLLQFINKGINYYEPLNKMEACCFFVTLGNYLSKYVSEAGCDTKKWPDGYQHLKKWFNQSKLPEEKSLIANHLLAIMGDFQWLNEEDDCVFRQAYFYSEAVPVPEDKLDLFLLAKKNHCIKKFSQENQQLKTNGVHRNLVANSILKDLLNLENLPTWNWKGDYPTCEVNEYRIDFEKGELYANDILCKGLSKQVYERYDFIKMFGGKKIVSKAISQNCYIIQDSEHPEGDLTRITLHGYLDLSIYRKINGKWFLYKDQFTEALTYEELAKNKFSWVEVEPQDKNHPEVYITDNSFELLYKMDIQFSVGGNKYQKFAIKKVVDLKNQHILVNFDANQEAYKFLESFESKKWIGIWRHEDKEEGIIELPQLDLQFDVKAQKAWSRQEPDYFLVKQEEWKGLRDQQEYLVLKNAAGKKKIILSSTHAWAPQLDKDNPLSSKYSKELPSSRESTQSYYIFDLDKENRLIPKNTEESLFLAHLYLRKSRNPEYAKLVLTCIKRAKSLRSYTAEEREIISCMLTKPGPNRDPGVVALTLKMAFLFLENRRDFPEANALAVDMKYLEELFIYNLQSDQNNQLLKLSKREEELILQEIKKVKPLHSKLVDLLEARQGANLTLKPANSLPHVYSKWTDADLEALYTEFSYISDTWLSKADALATSQSHPARKLLSSFKEFLEMANSPSSYERRKIANRMALVNSDSKPVLMMKDLLMLIAETPYGFDAYSTLPRLFWQDDKTAKWGNNKVLTDSAKAFFKNLFDRYEAFRSKKEKEKGNVQQPAVPEAEKCGKVLDELKMASLQEAKPTREIIPIELPPRTFQIENVENYFTFAKEGEENQEKVDFAFRKDYEDEVVNTYLRDYNLDIEEANKLPQTVRAKTIVNSDELLKILEGQATEHKAVLKQLKSKLLDLANKQPDSKILQMIQRLDILGKRKTKIKLQQLLGLYLQGNAHYFKKLNANLKDEEIAVLNQLTSNYLELALAQQKRTRAIDNIKKYSKPGLDEAQKAEEAWKLHEELTSYRQYDANTPLERVRAFQVFEFMSGMQIRKKQIDIIENILDGKIKGKEQEFISQLIMGGGKSKIILPILALLLSNGKQIPIIVVPKQLLEIQKEFMATLSGGLFDQEANTIDFHRDSPFTLEKLESIHDTLTRVTRNQEYLITSPESLQALELRYVEARKMLAKTPNKIDMELENKIALLGDILRLLRESGLCIIDEADSILDPKKKLIFTLQDGEPIPTHELKCVRDIYEQLTTDPEINALLKLRENQQVSHSKDHYATIKDALALKWAKEFCFGQDEIDQFVKFIKKEETVIPEFIQKMDVKVKDKIRVLRDELNNYLPLTLSRYGFQDYAFSEKKSVAFAIPAHHSQLAEGSQFGNCYESINYTLQMGLQEGMKAFQVGMVVASLRQKAYTQLKKGIPLAQTDAYKAFDKFYPMKSLFAVEPSDWEAVASHINKNPTLLLDFMETSIINQIQLFPIKLASDPFSFSDMFKKVYGFTGTPWNSYSYHERLKTIHDKGTDGLTINLLLKKEKRSALPFKENEKIQNPIESKVDALFEAMGSFEDGCNAFIDSGALFKGMSGLSVAQIMLKRFKKTEIKGIIFFHKNELVILERNQKRPIPLSRSSLQPSECFTFYDDAHTIGADIKQKFNARALVSISENLFLKDLLQAVWRMRGLAGSQTVHFLLSDDCKRVINTALGKKDLNSAVNTKDLLSFTAINQAKRQGDDVARSSKQKIVNTVRNLILQTVLENEVDHPDEAQEIFEIFDVDGIFCNIEKPQSLEDSCKEEKDIEAETYLKAQKTKWENTVNESINARRAKKGLSPKLRELFTQIENTVSISLKALPTPAEGRMPASFKEAAESIGTEVQLEKQVQQNTEMQTQLETQVNEQVQNSANANEVIKWGFSSFFGVYDIGRSQSQVHALDKELLKENDFKDLAQWFSEEQNISVLMTHNFHAVKKQKPEDSLSKFFDRQQKPIVSLFMNTTGTTKQYLSVYLCSEDDMKEISAELNKSKQRGTWIYDLRLNEHHHVGQMSDVTQWTNDERFKRLEVKLRLLNGETDFTEEQEKVLKEIIQKMGAKKFLKLFSKIVAVKESAKTFEGSILQKVIAQMFYEEKKKAADELWSAKAAELLEARKERDNKIAELEAAEAELAAQIALVVLDTEPEPVKEPEPIKEPEPVPKPALYGMGVAATTVLPTSSSGLSSSIMSMFKYFTFDHTPDETEEIEKPEIQPPLPPPEPVVLKQEIVPVIQPQQEKVNSILELLMQINRKIANLFVLKFRNFTRMQPR